MLSLFTRNVASPAGLTLVKNSTGNIYALFDSALAATALPANLPSDTPLFVTAYTDLPAVAGYSALEVITLDLTSLPFLVGTDPLTAASSPLSTPTEMRFTDFRLVLEAGTPRLRALWPAAYASAVTVSFDTSTDLTHWSDDPAFSGLNIGSGYFIRDVTFTGAQGFFRAHVRLKR